MVFESTVIACCCALRGKELKVGSGSGPLIITFRDPFENKLWNLSSLLLAKNSKNRDLVEAKMCLFDVC